MTGVILSLIVAFLKAIGEYTGKLFTSTKNKNAIPEYDLAFGGRLMGAFLTLPVLFFIPLKGLSLEMFLILLASGALNALATVTALKAVKYGDLSVVGPLSAFTIPFLIFTGYIIGGELPNFMGIIGVLLIFIGTYFLGVSETKKGLLGPIHSLLEDTGARYMLFTAAIWSITGPLDKLGIVEYGVFLWMFYVNSFIVICMIFYSLLIRKKGFSEIRNLKALKKITIITIIGSVTLLIQMFATKLTLVIYAISIKRASGLFSVLLGYLYFDEKNIGWKLFAACVMMLGVFCIAFFGNI